MVDAANHVRSLVSDAVMSRRVLHSSPIKAAFVKKYIETGAFTTILNDNVSYIARRFPHC